MNRGLVDSASQTDAPNDRRIYGVAIAQVIANCDQTRLGRVQVRLSWLPDYAPWARLVSADQGTYFIPKVGDEVLVAFNHGDVTDAYVIGHLWNSDKRPPEKADPVNTRMIQTPKGHEIVFDDQAKSIAITSSEKHQVTINPSEIKITLAEDKGSITLDKSGNITIKAATSITLDAPTINLKGTKVDIKSQEATQINAGGRCSVDAAQIFIG